MDIKYVMIIYWSGNDGSFLVEVPELPGCMADGQSYEEAIQNTQIVVKEWIKIAKSMGRENP